KRHGLSDDQIGALSGHSGDVVKGVREALGINPVFKTVDTCAAEFASATPYHYSSYDQETEVEPRERPAVLILGSGPDRIGQGIEFDYSCVHAALALGDPELPGGGYETVMINCNAETGATDYDIADRPHSEPLTCEDAAEGDGAGRRRQRPAGRPDPAGPRPPPRGRRPADHRHQPRRDRQRRGPRPLRCAAGRGGPARAPVRDRLGDG